MPKGTFEIRKIEWMLVSIGVMLVIHFLPLPQPVAQSGDTVELTVAGKSCIAILTCVILLWVTEAIPFAATALLIYLLVPIFGVASLSEVVEVGFGNSILMFLLGVLLLSCAFTRSGLGARLSYLLLARLGVKSSSVIMGFLFTGTILSMWLSNMAVAAMLLPVGVGILKSIGAKPGESNFGRALMIACCWGPAFGGLASPAGAAPNPMIIGLLREMTGIELSFAKWMLFGVPSGLLMVPMGCYLLLKIFPPEIKELPISVKEIEQKLDGFGPLTMREINVMIIFVLTAVLWVFTPWIKSLTGGRINLSISGVALFAGVLMFLPWSKVITWKEAQEDLDWGGIVLIMGGMSIGMMLFQTGAARWLSMVLLGKVATLNPVWMVFVISLIVIFIKVIFTSNTITGVIMIPILIGLSRDADMDPWLMVAPAALASSLAIILVTSSPSNVIPYSAGYFSIADMVKSGIIMSILAAVVITFCIMSIGSLTGYYTFS